MEEKMDLRQLLEDAKLTQAQLAKELGVPLQTVQDWVDGKGKLPDNCYEKLANALIESEEAHTVERWEVCKPGRKPLRIAGTNLRNAISRNTDEILALYKNELGYEGRYLVAEDTMSYNDTLFGGKGGCELVLKTETTPPLSDKTCENNIPETRYTSIWITAEPDELPEPRTINHRGSAIWVKDILKKKGKYAPDYQYGAAISILEALSRYTYEKGDDPYTILSCRYSGMIHTQPYRLLELCEEYVLQRRPKNIPYLKRLWDILEKIKENVKDIKDPSAFFLVGRYGTRSALAREGYLK